jgi:putative Mg2+ transporter-C (MgtC) family protein
VIQGIAAGIGFIGAGTILKLQAEQRVRGLTTAATIWVTAAAGIAVGLGVLWPAVFGVLVAWFVLLVLGRIEYPPGRRQEQKDSD